VKKISFLDGNYRSSTEKEVKNPLQKTDPKTRQKATPHEKIPNATRLLCQLNTPSLPT
jgi:hypothetical protein